HLAIGTREEAGYGARAREIAAALAMHFERGQDAGRAVQYWQQVGETALQRHAHPGAAHAFTPGLTPLHKLADTAGRTPQECALQLALGEVLEATNGAGSPEAETAYRRAFVLCQQLAASPQLWHILKGLTNFHLVRAELPTAYTLAERFLEVAQQLDDPSTL